jgi:hypothetical protein
MARIIEASERFTGRKATFTTSEPEVAEMVARPLRERWLSRVMEARQSGKTLDIGGRWVPLGNGEEVLVRN